MTPFLVLRPSRIHGVGVFTTITLPVGRSFAIHPPNDLRWSTRPPPAALMHLAVFDEDRWWTYPRHPLAIGFGWYLNHSAQPNVRFVNLQRVRVIRRIIKGHELLLDYETLAARKS
jgi:hypothetical protein